MIEIPEREDMRHLQKQINAIYDYLKVQPLTICKTDETGFVLMESSKLVPETEGESNYIRDRFHK